MQRTLAATTETDLLSNVFWTSSVPPFFRFLPKAGLFAAIPPLFPVFACTCWHRPSVGTGLASCMEARGDNESISFTFPSRLLSTPARLNYAPDARGWDGEYQRFQASAITTVGCSLWPSLNCSVVHSDSPPSCVMDVTVYEPFWIEPGGRGGGVFINHQI